MKIGTKLALIGVGSVVLAGLSAVFIPMPYGAIIATLLGAGGSLWIRSFFNVLK